MRCAVINCQYATMAPTKKEQICFFKFPRNADLAKRWLLFSGNRDALKVKNASICMKHFKDEDILGARKFELGIAKKRTLRQGAEPCINPGNETQIRKTLLAELLADAEEADMAPESTEFTPSYDRYNTGNATEPDVVSPPPIEDTAYLQTISHEDCPEADADEVEADENQESHQFNKCRTCYRDYDFDSNAEDPFDKANSVMLFRIEVICGVWLSNIEGGPRFMCPDCQLSLKNAIDFREMVISTEVMLTQGRPVCDNPEDQIELDSIETDQRTSVPEWPNDSVSDKMAEDDEDDGDEDTRYEDIYDASPSPVRSHCSNKMDHMEIIETAEENINPTRTEVSVGRGAKFYDELLNEVLGQDKVKPEMSKLEIKAGKPAKEQPKLRKMKIQEIRQDYNDDDSKFVVFEKKNKSKAKKSKKTHKEVEKKY
ncbi:uncharacterized protein [Drosophila pseudoobscura]|uniref:THAP-type domain-containing protein n=1 Tax=Drosophila pseudoobscura pseudoobscura TaxID=46245 RepID=A0A6I8V3U9_DROPS|nr:uncharacterized protein LOC6897941 [Drosophila pseudoobscura]